MSKKGNAFDDLVGEMESDLGPEEVETTEESEASAEPAAAEAEAQEPESDTKAEEVADTAPEPDGDAEPESEPVAAADSDADSDDAKEAAEKEALRREIVRLRMNRRMEQADRGAMQAPNPASPAQAPVPSPTAQQQPASSDGLIWEDGRARVDPAFIRAQIEAAMRPDPQAAAAQREESLRRSFVGMDDGSIDRAATYSRADEAMDYFQLKLWEMAQTTGANLSALGIDGILSVATDSGLLAEIQKHYPDVAPHVPDFLIAGTLPEKHGELAMRQVLSRYHADRISSQAPAQAVSLKPAKPAALQNTAKGQVRADRPPSTARIGSPPTGDNASSKKQREVQLTDKLAANPFNGLSAAEQRELDSLRQDLGL